MPSMIWKPIGNKVTPLDDEEIGTGTKMEKSTLDHGSITTAAARLQETELKSKKLHYDWVKIRKIELIVTPTTTLQQKETLLPPLLPPSDKHSKGTRHLDAKICVSIEPLCDHEGGDEEVDPEDGDITDVDDENGDLDHDEDSHIKNVSTTGTGDHHAPKADGNETARDGDASIKSYDVQLFERFGFVWLNKKYEVLKPQSPLLYIEGNDFQGPWQIDRIVSEKEAESEKSFLKIYCSSTSLSTIPGQMNKQGVALTKVKRRRKRTLHFISFRNDDVANARKLNSKWESGRLSIFRPITLFARMTIYSLNAMDTVAQVPNL